MNEDGALFDSGFDGVTPFRDTPEAGGISLESALRDFGPAALDDLIPRIRSLAAVLDAAHAAGAVHGALHPSKVIITDQSTSLIAGTSSSAPYVAPEVADGGAPTPKSDQYSLAAIAYGWLFGRPFERTSARSVEVRNMPGVDRAALSNAFTRALSPRPGDRFDSCSGFCHGLEAALVPELPLLALDAASDPEPLVSHQTTPIDTSLAEEIRLAPDFDALDRESPDVEPVTATVVERVAPESVAFTPPQVRTSEPARFGGMALILAAIVGSIFGFAAGYLARPRALQSGPPQTFATAPGTGDTVAPKPAEATVPAPKATAAAKAAPAAKAVTGQLLVRTNPTGARVSVDGVERGVTPLTLRDVEFGTRAIALSRPGYVGESRTVAITPERPSRSVDVRLTAERAAAPAKRPAAAPAAARPAAAATGILVIESRPTGAAVAINGTSRGVTPLTISDLAPGDYRIVMSMPGFVNFATTARVVAGERVRAAASLTAQEQE